MKKSTQLTYVTEKTFRQASKRTDLRFEQVDQHFKQVDQRFKQVDQRFEQIDRRFEQVDQRFEQVDRRFEQVDRRFEQVDQRFDRVEVTLNRVAIMVSQHDVDIKEIKATMMTKKDGEKIFTFLDGILAEFREARNSTLIHLNQLMDFRPQIDNHETRLVALENRGQTNS